MSIYSILPDHEALLALEPEELAGAVLEYLNANSHNKSILNRHNFSLDNTVDGYPIEYKEDIKKALMEAWIWLEREGLIAPLPGQDGQWVFLTRRGKRITKASDLNAYKKANILPARLLHPIIAQKVWSTFIRGDYDTAVFQAFKEVEISTRKAGGFSKTDIGVDLMRKAFKPNTGSLSDHSLPIAEQEALSNFFAGSIGLYKNPHSHRHVPIQPEEAVEIITLASHLMQIIDSRTVIP